MIRVVLVMTVVSTLLLCACPSAVAQVADPCAGIACGGYGKCFVHDGAPACACFQGYTLDQTGSNCVPIAPATVVQPVPAPAPQPAAPPPSQTPQQPPPAQPAQPSPPSQQYQQQPPPQPTEQQQYQQYQQQQQQVMDYQQWLRFKYSRGYISKNRYVWGGLIGTVVGFGVGHAIHRTYRDFGWAFTVGEVLGVGVFLAGGFGVIYGYQSGTAEVWAIFSLAGLVLYGAIKIWEIIDVWMRGHKKIVKPGEYYSQQHPVAVLPTPVLFDNGGGVGLAGVF